MAGDKLKLKRVKGQPVSSEELLNDLKSVAISHENEVSDERLLENILNLWRQLGKQPVRKDLETDHSQFSQTPYNRRFGSWTNALKAFIEYSGASEVESTAQRKVEPTDSKAKTGRDPSPRLRYQVLKRDHFSCKTCGASPANDVSVDLHIDHVIPWSKGGQTLLENLQTLCANCNLGKGNLHD